MFFACYNYHSWLYGFILYIEESVKELVNPDKTPGQVITESDIGHDLYVRTHNDYYPGEKTNRRYADLYLNISCHYSISIL